MPDLYEQIVAAGKKPKPQEVIRIDRSNLDVYAKCSFWAKAQLLAEIYERWECSGDLDYSDQWWLSKFELEAQDIPVDYRKRPDADADRPANVGVAFHAVMAEYIDELLASGDSRSPEALCQLAVAADARYQPELLHLAKLTGARISIWQPSYVAHEKQFSYTLERFGPRGEDVVLSCRPDLGVRGYGKGEIKIVDWKTGWSRNFGLQPMFYSVVTWRYIEDVEQVTWQPFYCRRGSWGKPYVYNLQDLEANEHIIKSAVGQMLTEEEWAPQPGFERCQYCSIKHHCNAERRYADIDTDRVAFAGATEKMQAEIADRIKTMKANVAANGPIQVDDHYWGVNVISQRATFKRNKGEPGYLGEEESEDADE